MIQSNELPITPELLEQMMAEGGTRMLSVKPGPSPEARIVGARWDLDTGHPLVVLVYDRSIEQPLLHLEAGLEGELAELKAEVLRLGAAGLGMSPGVIWIGGDNEQSVACIDADEVPRIAALLSEAQDG